eukprot:m.467163 g.467163  ORF g.467163 m.467163 type:complete len:125 (+) comp20364_c0_seq18:1273-1647(+)
MCRVAGWGEQAEPPRSHSQPARAYAPREAESQGAPAGQPATRVSQTTGGAALPDQCASCEIATVLTLLDLFFSRRRGQKKRRRTSALEDDRLDVLDGLSDSDEEALFDDEAVGIPLIEGLLWLF